MATMVDVNKLKEKLMDIASLPSMRWGRLCDFIAAVAGAVDELAVEVPDRSDIADLLAEVKQRTDEVLTKLDALQAEKEDNDG